MGLILFIVVNIKLTFRFFLIIIRFMHERLRTHAESIAFFGGGSREKAVSYFILSMCVYSIWMPVSYINCSMFFGFDLWT